jgi:hypothetical protein
MTDKKVTLELNVFQAAAVRASLFSDTKEYTYNPERVPERVAEIREAIIEIDKQLEDILQE